MHTTITDYQQKVFNNENLTKKDLLFLSTCETEALCEAANEIRQQICGSVCEICTIINAKSGKCSEDCRYCAQSCYYATNIETYPLLDNESIVKTAKKDFACGAQRFSTVTSGRKLSEKEVENLAKTFQKLQKEVPSLKLCASCGLLNQKELQILKKSGLTRYHNNLETSENFFSHICSTHTTQDKLRTLQDAKELGLQLCSGGIIGLGESWEDRIDLALQLRDLHVVSIPINILNPIPGTPLAHHLPLPYDEIRKTFALFRLALPTIFIRLAGGRTMLPDKGRACFQSGANALISGDMLTTKGYDLTTDIMMLRELGFEI